MRLMGTRARFHAQQTWMQELQKAADAIKGHSPSQRLNSKQQETMQNLGFQLLQIKARGGGAIYPGGRRRLDEVGNLKNALNGDEGLSAAQKLLDLGIMVHNESGAAPRLLADSRQGPLYPAFHPFMAGQQRMFDHILGDPHLRDRFIAYMDAVTALDPSCDRALIADLAAQYFHPDVPIPSLPFRWSLTAPALSMKIGTALMGNRFLGGADESTAVRTFQRLYHQGYLSTLDVVQESVHSYMESHHYFNRVRRLLELLGQVHAQEIPVLTKGGIPIRHVSCKASGLTPHYDPLCYDLIKSFDPRDTDNDGLPIYEAGGNLLQLFKAARDARALVNLDMEDFSTRDMTTELFWHVLTHRDLEGWDEAGLVVQCYLEDSPKDLKRQIALAKKHGKRIQLRLVKGAYWKYEQMLAIALGIPIPVLINQEETNANLQACLRYAAENCDQVRVALGCHNKRDMAYIDPLLDALRLDRDLVERQVLYGLGGDIAGGLRRQQNDVRYYVPCGAVTEGMPYLVRRLFEVGPDSAMAQGHRSSDVQRYDPRGEVSLSPSRLQYNLEPHPEWHRRTVREAMQRAVAEQTAADPMIVHPIVGDGKQEHNKRDQRAENSVNPADKDQVIAHVYNASLKDTDDAIAAAQTAFDIWSGWTQTDRSNVICNFAQAMRDNKEKIAALINAEAGKPRASSIAGVDEAINFAEYYAKCALREAENYEAIGVVGVISPFNFPWAITVGQVLAAIASGNVALLKPAEQCPATAHYFVTLLRQVLREAGAPESVIQVLPGGKEVGEKIVKSPHVDGLAFTGSEPIGKLIYRQAAKHPSNRIGAKKIVCETGGNNTIIVDSDADLVLAVDAILESAFQFNGQRCSAARRVVVLGQELADKLEAKLIEGAKSMVFGDTREAATQLGPVISELALHGTVHAKGILPAIKDGEDQAHLAYAAEVPEELARKGPYIGPHIFTGVKRDTEFARKEIFGPVLSVMVAQTFEEAVETANDNGHYALTAGLISRNPAHVKLFLDGIQAGNVYINRSIIGADPVAQPFGGYLNSGGGPNAGSEHIVPAFMKARDQQSVPEHVKVPEDWLQSSAAKRIAALERLACILGHMSGTLGEQGLSTEEQILRNKAMIALRAEPGGQGAYNGSLKKAYEIARRHAELAPYFLTRRETINRPGERNEVVHDRPLGIGLLWGHDQSLSDLIVSASAAICMGNQIVMQKNDRTTFMGAILRQAGFDESSFRFASEDDDISDPENFDFVVAFGPEGIQLHQNFQRAQRQRVGFIKIIGQNQRTDEWRYLSYFAHQRTLTENTKRHGADLGSLRDFAQAS
jgi:RHH-type transcriptional regulator, proline utilization regulon repressor / proline dehydrogenase / delta 1-pyrroline-5-carboxylate dehydrogenase